MTLKEFKKRAGEMNKADAQMGAIVGLGQASVNYRVGNLAKRSKFEDLANNDIMFNKSIYHSYIYGSFEYSLASAALHLLQAVTDDELKNFDMVMGNLKDANIGKMTMNEKLFKVSSACIEPLAGLAVLFRVCEQSKIDIVWHIDAKLKYDL